MKIVAPASSLKEIEMLAHFGADEIYCGVTTPEWELHFGSQWWMNRRSPIKANFASWDDLGKAVAMAHSKNIRVYVTLNAHFYPSGSINYLLKLAERLVHDLSVDGFIVSDVNFLIALSKLKLPAKIHLSSLASCFNSWSCDFFVSLGVTRIILPRQFQPKEIRSIVSKGNPDLRYEVFAVNDGCLFEEGLCQTSHTLGPFCLTDWDIELRRVNDTQSPPLNIEKHLEALKEYLWYLNNCGSSAQAEGIPNGPCSLCWFGHFRNWGIEAVKIVGREASFFRKMMSLQLVKAVMEHVDAGEAPEQIAEFARSVRNTPEYCDKKYMCYFREN
jgi:putative protease